MPWNDSVPTLIRRVSGEIERCERQLDKRLRALEGGCEEQRGIESRANYIVWLREVRRIFEDLLEMAGSGAASDTIAEKIRQFLEIKDGHKHLVAESSWLARCLQTWASRGYSAELDFQISAVWHLLMGEAAGQSGQQGFGWGSMNIGRFGF